MAIVGYNPQRLEEPMAIPDELLDSLMKDYNNPEDLIGESGLIKLSTFT